MFLPSSSLTETQHLKFDFRKKHHFGYKNDVPILLNETESKVGSSGKTNSHNVKYESKIGTAALRLQIPDWIAFKNQILKFGAVSNDASQIFTKDNSTFYDILYFLEDDTIQVVETNHKNDPRFRGTILKRHQILKVDGTHFTLDDFNVNQEISFYGRSYAIYKCDKYTRDYLINLGIQVPPDNQEIVTAERVSTSKERPRDHSFKQFLEYDGSNLQFRGLWIQKAGETRVFRRLLLLYYLADDTIEIRSDDEDDEKGGGKMGETQDRSREASGHLPKRRGSRSKILVRRSKLPKKKPIEPLPGMKLDRDDLTDNCPKDYYQDMDLQIGNTINAWGRQVLIYDCDDFTKQFIKIKYGLDVQAMRLEDAFPELIARKDVVDQESQAPSEESQQLPSFPPYHSPTAKRDFIKFMTKDKNGSQSHILRFLATIDGPSNQNRQFVISYYLVNDTISIFEKPCNNSGYRGGKFMECSRVPKRKDGHDYVSASDLRIGEPICINGHWFHIVDADEYTLNYMEQHPHEFPSSSKLEIVNKLKNLTENKVQDLKRLFSEKDFEGVGSIDEMAFRSALHHICPEGSLNEQEIVALKREYQFKNEPRKTKNSIHSPPDYFSPIFQLQTELKKVQFGDFKGLLDYFEKQDVARTGFLKEERALRSCIAYPLPAKKYLINAVLQRFVTKNDGINYRDFISRIDWKLNPSHSVYNDEDCVQKMRGINYKQLLTDIECFH